VVENVESVDCTPPSPTFYTFTALIFSAWQGCSGFLANLKVCTNTKKLKTTDIDDYL